MHAGLHVGRHICTGIYVNTPTSVYMYIWRDGWRIDRWKMGG